jgi:hypothetical protein
MKKIFLIITLFVIIGACKNNGSDVIPSKSTLEYLTGTGVKKWKISGGTVNLDGLEVDIATQPPCYIDNILTLSKDFSYELDEGSIKCAQNDPQIAAKAKWLLEEDPRAITIDKFVLFARTVEKSKFLITSIDDNTFVGKTSVTVNSRSAIANITFIVVK